MSKVSYINKILLPISKFQVNILCSYSKSGQNGSLNKLYSSKSLSSLSMPLWSPRNNARPVCFAEKLQLNSNVRHISCWYHVMSNTNKHKDSTPLDEQTGEDNNTSEEAKQSDVEKELNKKIELLAKEVEGYKDKYQRSLAERENLRHRLEKQIADSKLFGIQSFCKDLLDVSDVFRKALESVPEDKLKVTDPIFMGLYDGVVMTENQLLNVFRRHGLQKIIPAEGEKFDPSVQEAMFEVPATEGKLPGTIAHVVRSGWKLHDRCVRSAQVGVVKH